MKRIGVAVALLALLGCVSTEERLARWNACISAGQFSGDKIKHDEGRMGKVVEVYGRSARCTESRHPNLAEVAWE